jgi:transposase
VAARRFAHAAAVPAHRTGREDAAQGDVVVIRYADDNVLGFQHRAEAPVSLPRHNDWKNPREEEAEITKLKDGRTALVYKAENAVDMETGAIVAVTTHSEAAADTTTVKETVMEAGIAVAGLIAEKTLEGAYECIRKVCEMEVRSYIAEPDRGPRNWDGKQVEKQAVHCNRRRIQGERGKRLQRRRGERIERNIAHQFDTGGLDRLYVRGLENVHKKLLIQAAARNLALLLRSRYGAGKPRAAHDRTAEVILMILAVIK